MEKVPLSLERTMLMDEEVKLPCILLPTFKTARFFDRDDVIDKIENYFNQVNTDNTFRSLALYGLGGVGKSSVALKYAETRVRRGDIDALFWVYSEKLTTIKESFSNIALRLKLPEAQRGYHEENHSLVSRWLQHTRK